MNKKWWLLFGFLLFSIIGFAGYFRLRAAKDSWVCQGGKWVKSGNPVFPMPVKPCEKEGEIITVQTSQKDTSLVNPAAQNCLNKGGSLDYRQESAGTLGICRFEDGSECEEWQFYQEKCQKGQYQIADTSHPYRGLVNKSANGYTFRDEGGLLYLLKLPENPAKEMALRLAIEAGTKEPVTIIASETPPLSQTLILKGFQEK